jgi:glycogen operon protein
VPFRQRRGDERIAADFRFDLASALARELLDVDKLGAFFDIIHQDRVLSQVKLIAEPWDLGAGGYQVGNFPFGWMEWNGKYRDAVRRFWRGDEGSASEFATRLSGSSDLYEQSGRRPYASVNFVTSHDGFTMRDLVSYSEKHNVANGENNGDGEKNNLSWNCGAEGPTDDPAVLSLRKRQHRNLLATLLLSQGVPMILAGDEWGRTQQGNNNPYCQDNEVSWLDWNLDAEQSALLEFVCTLVRLKLDEPVLHRPKFFQGRPIRGTDIRDIWWLESNGQEMTDESWGSSFVRCLGVYLPGDAMADVDERGERLAGNSLLLLLNAHTETVDFMLPTCNDDRWTLLFDTAAVETAERIKSLPRGQSIRSRIALWCCFVSRKRRKSDPRCRTSQQGPVPKAVLADGGFVKKAGIDQMSPPQLSYCLCPVAAYNAGTGRVATLQ